MCWKQEYASAIGNLQHAIEHINRAQEKLKQRQDRNEDNLKKKWKDRYEGMKIKARIEKNQMGQGQCEKMITDLKDCQDQLFKMIHEYGISHSESPKRMYKLMGKYPFAENIGMIS